MDRERVSHTERKDVQFDGPLKFDWFVLPHARQNKTKLQQRARANTRHDCDDRVWFNQNFKWIQGFAQFFCFYLDMMDYCSDYSDTGCSMLVQVVHFVALYWLALPCIVYYAVVIDRDPLLLHSNSPTPFTHLFLTRSRLSHLRSLWWMSAGIGGGGRNFMYRIKINSLNFIFMLFLFLFQLFLCFLSFFSIIIFHTQTSYLTFFFCKNWKIWIFSIAIFSSIVVVVVVAFNTIAFAFESIFSTIRSD